MENNIFLIKYHKYNADHNLVYSWISCTCDFDRNDALIRGKYAINRWNKKEKLGEFYYTFEPLEYAPVVKENDGKEQ